MLSLRRHRMSVRDEVQHALANFVSFTHFASLRVWRRMSSTDCKHYIFYRICELRMSGARGQRLSNACALLFCKEPYRTMEYIYGYEIF